MSELESVFQPFVRRFLPAGVSSSHEVLYDWDQKITLELNEALVADCAFAYAHALAQIPADNPIFPVDMHAMEANELLLAYLGRAKAQDVPLPKGPLIQEVITRLQQALDQGRGLLGGRVDFMDGFKRAQRIIELLSDQAATR